MLIAILRSTRSLASTRAQIRCMFADLHASLPTPVATPSCRAFAHAGQEWQYTAESLVPVEETKSRFTRSMTTRLNAQALQKELSSQLMTKVKPVRPSMSTLARATATSLRGRPVGRLAARPSDGGDEPIYRPVYSQSPSQLIEALEQATARLKRKSEGNGLDTPASAGDYTETNPMYSSVSNGGGSGGGAVTSSAAATAAKAALKPVAKGGAKSSSGDGGGGGGVGGRHPKSSAKQWEFDRSHVARGDKVGEGMFGVVYTGRATGIVPGEAETKVAIKTLQSDNADVEKDFFQEVDIMKGLDG